MIDFSPTHFRVWNTMRLGWAKDCPQKLYYAGIMGYNGKHEGYARRFGREYQFGLEQFDRFVVAGDDHDAALHRVVRIALERTWERTNSEDEGRAWGPTVEDREPNRNRETLVRSLVWYLDHFAEDPAKTIVLADGKPAVELTYQMDAGFGPVGKENYVFSGHLDRVVEFAGSLFVVDHKHTVKTLSGQYFEQYDMDNQMSMYSLAAQVVFNTPVKGIMIDAAQVAVGFTRFERGFTFRDASRLEEWIDDARYWIGQAQSWDANQKWPHNDRHCFLCEFKRICAKSPAVRDTFLASDFYQKAHDPLEVR